MRQPALKRFDHLMPRAIVGLSLTNTPTVGSATTTTLTLVLADTAIPVDPTLVLAELQKVLARMSITVLKAEVSR